MKLFTVETGDCEFSAWMELEKVSLLSLNLEFIEIEKKG